MSKDDQILKLLKSIEARLKRIEKKLDVLLAARGLSK